VLVYFNGQVGFAPTVEEALNEALGQSSDATPPPEDEEPPSTSTPPSTSETPPDTGGGGETPEMAQAVQDIADALDRLRQARASGDFVAEGEALADLDRAGDAFEAAEAANGGNGGGNGTPPSSSSAPSGNGGG
jgi:uncharacterized protein